MIKKINFEKMLLIFIIVQPFLDFYLLYSDQIINIFKFSPTTIIRISFVSISLLYVIYKTKYNKKYFWILGYLILILIYLILYVLNSLNFDTSIGQQFSFSYITEFFYFIRMFIPIIIIYITYHSKIADENFRKTITTVSLIFSLIIIVLNIFKLSLTSYGGNNFISANIFNWFVDNNYTFEQLSSKGFFYMANQISGVLILLLPINIYYAIKTSKKLSIITSFFVALSMIMLGTRVATYGWFLISIAVFIIWIFFAIIQNNKIKITVRKLILYIILVLVLILITMNSPLMKRKTSLDFENIENKNLSAKIKNNLKNLDTNDETKKFIKEYSEKYSIPLVYVENIYPYDSDPNFWIQTMKLPYSKRGGNRNLQNLIIKRVYELNNNKSDKFFGMGYSRFRNAKIYIEQDFVVHYYTLGIFGIILFLIPYFIVASFALVYMLIKNKLKVRTTILCMSIYLTLFVSYFSGNMLDELIVTIILGFVCGFVLKDVLKQEKNYTEELEIVTRKVLFISSTGGHLNELMQLKPLMKKYDSYLITEKTKSTVGLKNKFDKVNYLIFGTKDHKISYILKFSYNCVKSLILYIKIRPNIIITTGTHTAVPMCYIGKICGSKIIFIETFANSKTKTLSGKLVYPIADTFIVQWKSMLELYPKAIYGGWIY